SGPSAWCRPWRTWSGPTPMVQRFPDRPQYGVQLGAVRVKLGDHAGAEQVLGSLPPSAPEGLRAQAQLELTRSHLARHRPAQALRRLLAARAEGADGSHGAQVGLLQGEIFEQLGEPDKAAEAYRQVLKHEADSEPALAALVRLEVAAGRRPEALD